METRKVREEKLMLPESIEYLRDDIYRTSLGEVDEYSWLSLYGTLDNQFDLSTVKQLSDYARAVYLKNPLINRAVRLKALTIFGQSFSINLDNEEDHVKDFTEDLLKEEFFSDFENLFQIESELQVTGNIFLKIERADDEEFPYNISLIPIEEVNDFVFHPDESSRLILVKRMWRRTDIDFDTGEKITRLVKMWYPVDPNKNFFKRKAPKMIDDEEVSQNAAVFHIQSGSFPHWQWGVSEIYAAIDWAIAYKNFLTDVARIMRSHSEFAWEGTTAGSIESYQTKLRTDLNAMRQSDRDPDRTTRRENVFVRQPDSNLEPMRVRGSSVNPDDGRRLLLMVAAATGLPEIYYGDSDVGNHATAQIVERPTELQYRARQQVWTSLFMKVLKYVFQIEEIELKGEVHIAFPDVTEHDVKARVEAIMLAATLDGHKHAGMITRETTARLLMTELGVTDIDRMIEELKPIWQEIDSSEKEKVDLEIEQIRVQNRETEKRTEQMPSVSALQRSSTNGTRQAA